MKKINVRSPYYITVDSFIAPPKVVPVPSGTYYYLNVFSSIYGVDVSSYTQSEFESLVCENCIYTWKLSNGDKVQLINADQTVNDCGETTCNEDVQYTTYKAQRVPLEVGDSIYTNADTPAVVTSLTGVVASNSINNPTSSTDVGESVCFGSKKRINRIYTVASGVVTSYVEPDNHCGSTPLTNEDKNVVCGQTINEPNFRGSKLYKLNTAQNIGDYSFTITGGNTPVNFTATWGTTTATTKYIGHSDYQDQLTIKGVNSSDTDLASPSSKASKTLTISKTAESPFAITLQAHAPIINDHYKITFNCPANRDNDSSNTDFLTFNSTTYINLWTGHDPVFSNYSGGSFTGTLETMRAGALKTSLLSFYADAADYNNKVQIKSVPWTDSVDGGSIDPILSFNYPFLPHIHEAHGGDSKTINIIFVSSAKGYYYYNEVERHGYQTASLSRNLMTLANRYRSFNFGRVNAYVVNLNAASGSYDTGEGRSTLSFQNLLKQVSRGYISSETEDPKSFKYVAETATANGIYGNTSYAGQVKYDWELDGVYRSISAGNLHTKIISYLNDLHFRDGSGGNLT